MGSSFTGYGGHGFWARDGILETWLAALADVGRPMPQDGWPSPPGTGASRPDSDSPVASTPDSTRYSTRRPGLNYPRPDPAGRRAHRGPDRR
jgi:hypothetical protein